METIWYTILQWANKIKIQNSFTTLFFVCAFLFFQLFKHGALFLGYSGNTCCLYVPTIQYIIGEDGINGIYRMKLVSHHRWSAASEQVISSEICTEANPCTSLAHDKFPSSHWNLTTTDTHLKGSMMISKLHIYIVYDTLRELSVLCGVFPSGIIMLFW